MSKRVPFEGLFASPEVQIANVRAWNRSLRWDFTDEDLEAAEDYPRWPLGDLQALVLTPYLATPQKTYKHLVRVGSENSGLEPFSLARWKEREIRLLQGVEHTPGLRWAKVDFGANRGCSGLEVRDPVSAPHAEVFAAVAHFPEWLRSMDGAEVPFVIVPGYEGSYGSVGHSWSSCLAISSPGTYPGADPSQRLVKLVDLCGWDDRHTVAEIIGRRFHLRQRKIQRHAPTLYQRAAIERRECDEIITRLVTAEILTMLSAQPGKAMSRTALSDEFHENHLRGSYNVNTVVIQKDINRTLELMRLEGTISITPTASGDLLTLLE